MLINVFRGGQSLVHLLRQLLIFRIRDTIKAPKRDFFEGQITFDDRLFSFFEFVSQKEESENQEQRNCGGFIKIHSNWTRVAGNARVKTAIHDLDAMALSENALWRAFLALKKCWI